MTDPEHRGSTGCRSRAQRVATGSLALLLLGLLAFPLHAPYQNPDQDVPALLALLDYQRDTWSPAILTYPSGLTNLLRLGYEALWRAGRATGRLQARSDLAQAWCSAPEAFRIPVRLLAMLGGALALWAVHALARLAGGSGAGVSAAALLGTSLMFVREHHHGMLDAPAAACVIAALLAAARHVARPSLGTIALAGVLSGLAAGFKYNVAAVFAAVLVAAVAAPGQPRGRVAAMGVALAAGGLAFAATTPAAVLEFPRLRAELIRLADVMRRVQGAMAPTNRFLDAVWLGLGPGLLAAALIGAVAAVVGRVRVLWPVIAFVLAYGAVLAATPLVLNRYALPLAPAIAVLGAYGIGLLRPPALRAGVTVALVAVALPPVVAHLRLLATEDTRVTAARWLERHLPPNTQVLVTCGVYAAPDLPDAAHALAIFGVRHLPLGGLATCRGRVQPVTALATPDPRLLALTAGGRVVVTCESPDPIIARTDTSPALLTAIAGAGDLLADFPVLPPDDAGGRLYEPFDLHWIPLRGAGTLPRPGPRIRIWRIRPR